MALIHAISTDHAAWLQDILFPGDLYAPSAYLTLTQPMYLGMSVLDLCLTHSAAYCLDFLLQVPGVAGWMLMHMEEQAHASGSAFLWQLVFHGPNPHQIVSIL
jgi:hypothetical protein